MANKIKILKVEKPFTLNGQAYAPGDEFALPVGWQEGQDPISSRTVYLEPYTEKYQDEKGELHTETFYRNHFLPLTHA